MKVVDASALVEILVGTPKGERADDAIGDHAACAPELICVEVASALARLVRARVVTEHDADEAMREFERTELELVPQLRLVATAWGLRDRVRISDAFYVACARQLDAAIVTCDGRLSRAALPGVRIDLIS